MIDVGGGFNPTGPINREWNVNPMQQRTMGGGGFRSMTGGGPMTGGGGGGMSGPMNMGGMQRPMLGGQQQRRPNRMMGGMVDPSYRNMMAAKAGQGTADRLTSAGFKGQTPSSGMFPGLPSGMFGQHFDQSGRARQPQMVQGPSNMGNMGQMNNPMMQMMQMMQMMPFFSMYNQMSQEQGSPNRSMFY